MKTDLDVYFFGVWPDNKAGHCTHYQEVGVSQCKHQRPLPFNRIGPFDNIDANFAPDQCHRYKEGAAALHYKNSGDTIWTCLAFWDTSGDHRPNSNSNFFIAQECTFEQMLELVEERFPTIWKRLKVRPFLVQSAEKPSQSRV